MIRANRLFSLPQSQARPLPRSCLMWRVGALECFPPSPHHLTITLPYSAASPAALDVRRVTFSVLFLSDCRVYRTGSPKCCFLSKCFFFFDYKYLTRFEMFYRIRQYSFQQTLKKMYSFVVCFHLPPPPPLLAHPPPTAPPWQLSPTPTAPVFLGCVLGGAWHPQRFSFVADRRQWQGLHRYPW